jgi:hypothetical protein
MIENTYYVYAKRKTEKNWSSWAQAKNSEMAFWHCEKIREAGFLAKVYDRKSRKVVVKDE